MHLNLAGVASVLRRRDSLNAAKWTLLLLDFGSVNPDELGASIISPSGKSHSRVVFLLEKHLEERAYIRTAHHRCSCNCELFDPDTSNLWGDLFIGLHDVVERKFLSRAAIGAQIRAKNLLETDFIADGPASRREVIYKIRTFILEAVLPLGWLGEKSQVNQMLQPVGYAVFEYARPSILFAGKFR